MNMIPPCRVLYRADGGHAIGTGHLLRAVRVLGELSRVTRLQAILAVADDDAGLTYAAAAGVPLCVLPRSSSVGPKPRFDPEPLLVALPNAAFDAVVVDMLDTAAGSLDPLRRYGGAVITLDDRGEGRFGADAIINFLVREPHRECLPPSVRLYEGPQYATLDDSYARRVRRRGRQEDRARVMVSLGGADAAGLTVKVARALTTVRGISGVDFVCGRAYRHEAELSSVLARAPWKARLVRAAPSLRPFFLRCDLAIVAGGMTMHEACCTGTPAVAVCQPIDHQVELAEWFEAEGAMVTVGDGTVATEPDIAEAVAALLKDPGRREAMRRLGPKLVDGRGTARTVSAILEVSYIKRGR